MEEKNRIPVSSEWQPTFQEEKEWQADLRIIRNLIGVGPAWKPKIEFPPWVLLKEMHIRIWSRKLMKLLTVRDENLVKGAKELFLKKDLKAVEIDSFLGKKDSVRMLKPRRLREDKVKLEEETKEKRKLYTFNLTKDENNVTTYHVFNGEKKLNFLGAKNFFDYLLEEKGENNIIVLFGWNSLSLRNLHNLLQESLLRGFFPTVRGSEKIGSCFLKGDSIIIKDPAHFYLKEKESPKKLDELYKLIETIRKKNINKYQVDILDKGVSTLAKVAWKDFWQTFRKDQEVNNWENIWDLNSYDDEFIRKAFRAGYSDLFNEQNYKGVVSDWDFKNYYSSLMAGYPYPISRPEWISHPQDFYGKTWKKDFYGFFECEIECLRENPYPFFTFQDGGSYIYRPGKYSAVLFSEEIKFFWEHTPLIKVEVGRGCTFRKREYIFNNWIRKLFVGQEKGDSSAKMKMNSVYGMFGCEKRQTPLVWSIKKTDKTRDEFRRKDGGKTYLNLSEETKKSWKFTNVGISAAIATYGRINLFKALLANWDNILYCATDGFVIKGTENKFKSKPVFYNCGELEKRGEYQGFISLASNVYAFKDDKGKLVGKGFLGKWEKNKFDFLFEKEITKENVEEIWNNTPDRQKGGILLRKVLDKIVNQKKKKLVNGKWEIFNI